MEPEVRPQVRCSVTVTQPSTQRRDYGSMDCIGLVDTMFARYDMGAEATDELASCDGFGEHFELVRRTVPGFKDLAVACRQLIDKHHCKVVVALGMAGRAPLDKSSALVASQGIMVAQLLTSTHILEVFVHEEEAERPEELAEVCRDRARKHARNAYWLIYEPEQLSRRAGQGIRQGFGDAGPLLRSVS